ncbi:BNR repeat-containing protein [Wenyingzhuangia sp. IMCC45467]
MISIKKKKIYILKSIAVLSCLVVLLSCGKNVTVSHIGKGWGNNSVNTVKFRKNALTTFKNEQFVAYYNENSYLTLGKRKLNAKHWELVQTQYKGNTHDAHNDISIAVDGNGFLHVSWDHHNTKLRYAKSVAPLSLKLGEESGMTGKDENRVTYPEFYNLPNGDLMFFYRSGSSGSGNLVINSYDVKSKTWTQLQNNLIDGQNKRNAYWQACVDKQGTIHISWVWRETWKVETNHDMCYARSKDGGKTWEKSTGEQYELPINLASAEYAWKIPQNSSLINQTAMTTDDDGNPYIATYWADDKTPQFQIIYLENQAWKKTNTGFRQTSFVLGGGGTKSIPISRPDILINQTGQKTLVSILFRDLERGNKISMAFSDLKNNQPWKVVDLSNESVGQWEPNYDISLWKNKNKLHVFMQNVVQIDGEGVAKEKTSEVKVLEIEKVTLLTNK